MKKKLGVDAEIVTKLIEKKGQCTAKLSSGWARFFFKKKIEGKKNSAENK